MRVAPLNDRILLKLREGADKTKSGLLYIPETGKDAPQIGDVIAVHPGREMSDGSIKPCVVQPGDAVLFGKYSGSEVEIDGEKYLAIREEDLIALLAEEDQPLEQSLAQSGSPA